MNRADNQLRQEVDVSCRAFAASMCSNNIRVISSRLPVFPPSNAKSNATLLSERIWDTDARVVFQLHPSDVELIPVYCHVEGSLTLIILGVDVSIMFD